MDSNSYPKKITSTIPKRRQDLIRWDGWGFKDSRFDYDGTDFLFTGSRYPIANGVKLNGFRDWIANYFDMDLQKQFPMAKEPPSKFPDPLRSVDFLKGLDASGVEFSEDGMDRLIRCHGQTLEDIESMRKCCYKRLPDVVIWPTCHDQVVKIVKLALESNVALIPIGGNSAVSGAVTTPEIDGRSIALLDMTQMNRILWLNKENMTACFEAGIVGQDIEKMLKQEGLTLGHEPDSCEFSTLGGWIATRASGMKKNVYGNIEDLVVRTRMVTGVGVLEKQYTAPRVSCGPDFDHMVFGSEGTLGVVTEAVVRLKPLPEVRRCGSLLFPDFETGFRFLRELVMKQMLPASIRLLDNQQFMIGQYLQPDPTWFTKYKKRIMKQYLTSICGLKMDQVAAATLLFEGDYETVKMQEENLYNLASKYGAVNTGSENGERGYVMTFVVAYIRDFGWDFNIMCESFETSVEWDKCLTLCENVKACVKRNCEQRGIERFMICNRVTQSYEDGCCVYFYLAFKVPNGHKSPVELFKTIEDGARDEILASGGTISHHHGVGKIRSKWYPDSVSQVGVGVLQAVKKELDPQNIFAAGNLVAEHVNNKL